VLVDPVSTLSPATDSSSDDLTVLLRKIGAGDDGAARRLFPLVYGELRKIAAAKMAHERPGQTLQPTALVHDAWLRLGGDEQPRWENRAHFFGAAAEAMRRILVDRARRKRREKHGGRYLRVDWENLDVAVTADSETVLAVHESLERLAQHDAIGARLIELRFFAGLSNVEAAQVLGLSERTAKRTWAYARAWLRKQLKDGGS
jgi:RNA polymerase sigma factor (TIGR02999 family)